MDPSSRPPLSSRRTLLRREVGGRMWTATVCGHADDAQDDGLAAEPVERGEIETGLRRLDRDLLRDRAHESGASTGLRQLLQQDLRLSQVRCREAFGEAAVNRCQQFARLRDAMPISPKPRETGRGSQLPRESVLAVRPVECAPKMVFGG